VGKTFLASLVKVTASVFRVDAVNNKLIAVGLPVTPVMIASTPTVESPLKDLVSRPRA
jgi:hypothetical protein